MPIPPRYRIPPVSDEEIQALSSLCDEIEDLVARRNDVTAQLAEWHRRTKRKTKPVEFTTYYGAMSKEEFIKHALVPPPEFAADLSYEHLRAIFASTLEADPRDQCYYLEWLESNLPGSRIRDLIFWPNIWFGNDSYFQDEKGRFKPDSELNIEQTLRYAMLQSGRILPDAPSDVFLPFPMPSAKAGGKRC